MTIEDRYYSVIQCPRKIQMQFSRKMYLKAFLWKRVLEVVYSIENRR